MDFSAISQFFNDFFENFWYGVSSILPISPVDNWLQLLGEFPYLSYLNWFCPIGVCVEIMRYWTLGISSYYLCSIVLRWIKAIQ